MRLRRKIFPEPVQPIIDRQIKLNSAIAQEGLDNNYGAQIGKTLMHVWEKSVITRAMSQYQSLYRKKYYQTKTHKLL